MPNQMAHFNRRLQNLLTASGLTWEELARRLGVTVPEVHRWRIGASVPDMYQFRAIAQFFGLPYSWFLDQDDFPGAAELADRLGLCESTVKALLDMAEAESAEVLDAVDGAVSALVSAVRAAGE